VADSSSGRIRVLRVIARMNMGGPAHQVALLSGRLDPGRYETLLVHGRLAAGEESMVDLAELEGATTEYLPALCQPVRPLRDLWTVARLVGIMRRFRPDVVHTHTAKAGFLGRIAALLARRPRPVIVHTYHGHVLEGYFGPAKTWLYRTLERLLGSVSDCLIGVSRATVDELVQLGVAPRAKSRVVPLGLELEGFAELRTEHGDGLREELGMDGECLLSYVGRVVPIKRLDVLLRAVALATRQGTPVRLAIVGDGEIRPRLERLASELGIDNIVNFLGYRRDITGITAATDVAVLSSDNEGTPVWLIEAAAGGRPAVATAVGGVPEVVTADTGVLVPPGDEGAFARALAELAGDAGDRDRMGATARDLALARYSIDRLLADIDALYSELLGNAAARSARGDINRASA
jgi:glycosyltransferase involved in cell wall biosynthesis